MLDRDEYAVSYCKQSYVSDDGKDSFNSHGVSGYYRIMMDDSKKIVYIIFTGTDSIKDWIYNSDLRKEVIPYSSMAKDTEIRVYNGAIRAYSQVRWIIHSIINKFLAKGQKSFIFTGHSLGGTIATLAGLDIKYCLKVEDIEIVTFNTPKIGNKQFAKSLDDRIPRESNRRYVIAGDIVHNFPWFQFSHAGMEFSIEKYSWNLFKMHSIDFMWRNF